MAEIERAPVSQHTLVEQLRGLGLPAAPVVVVHAALKAVGPVEGGPEGFIAVLRASPRAVVPVDKFFFRTGFVIGIVIENSPMSPPCYTV